MSVIKIAHLSDDCCPFLTLEIPGNLKTVSVNSKEGIFIVVKTTLAMDVFMAKVEANIDVLELCSERDYYNFSLEINPVKKGYFEVNILFNIEEDYETLPLNWEIEL